MPTAMTTVDHQDIFDGFRHKDDYQSVLSHQLNVAFELGQTVRPLHSTVEIANAHLQHQRTGSQRIDPLNDMQPGCSQHVTAAQTAGDAAHVQLLCVSLGQCPVEEIHEDSVHRIMRVTGCI